MATSTSSIAGQRRAGGEGSRVRCRARRRACGTASAAVHRDSAPAALIRPVPPAAGRAPARPAVHPVRPGRRAREAAGRRGRASWWNARSSWSAPVPPPRRRAVRPAVTALPWSASGTSAGRRPPRWCCARNLPGPACPARSRWTAPAPATGTWASRWIRGRGQSSPRTATTGRRTGPGSSTDPGSADTTWCWRWTGRTWLTCAGWRRISRQPETAAVLLRSFDPGRAAPGLPAGGHPTGSTATCPIRTTAARPTTRWRWTWCRRAARGLVAQLAAVPGRDGGGVAARSSGARRPMTGPRCPGPAYRAGIRRRRCPARPAGPGLARWPERVTAPRSGHPPRRLAASVRLALPGDAGRRPAGVRQGGPPGTWRRLRGRGARACAGWPKRRRCRVPEVLGWDAAGARRVVGAGQAHRTRHAAERFGRDLARLHAAGADRFGPRGRGSSPACRSANDR